MYCGKNPPRVGMETCLDCAARTSAYLRKRYAARKAQGLCTECGAVTEVPGRVRCGDCVARRSSYRDNNKVESGRRYRAKRLARGLCAHCNNPQRAGRTLCSDCAEEARRRKSDLKAQGLCVSSGCGAAAVPGKWGCSDCLARFFGYVAARRKRRIALGLCIACAGDKPSKLGRQKCIDCCARAVVKSNKSYHKRKDAERQKAKGNDD